MKILYLTVRERRPNRSNPTGKINGWKSILNTFAITYDDRLNINWPEKKSDRPTRGPHAGAPLDYTQVAARACPGTSDRRPHPAVFLWLLSPLPAPHGKARPRYL